MCHNMSQCDIICHIMSQCATECYNKSISQGALQCVTIKNSENCDKWHKEWHICHYVSQSEQSMTVCVIICHIALHYVTVCHNASQCVTICNNASQCVTMHHNVSQCVTMCHNVSQRHNASQCVMHHKLTLNKKYLKYYFNSFIKTKVI